MIYYTDFDISNVLSQLEIVKTKKGTYYNNDFALDIEVSSFYDIAGNKRAYSYIQMINVCGQYVYTRTLEDLKKFLLYLRRELHLNRKNRIIMYVHNLAYEFQFLRDICNFKEVFARTPRKPIKCYADNLGIEFRCSYFLSGLSLANLAKSLKLPEKLKGDLDYELIRHSTTPLTEKEMKYCERDIEILHYYILSEIEKNGNITNIPFTQTGYIRRECRERIFKAVDKKQYRNMIIRNTPDKDLFILLNKAFAGGDTHANYKQVGYTLHDVYSLDFASSYPTVMVKCKFPYQFTKIKILNREMFENLIQKKACIMKISFEHIKAKHEHHTLSKSKCETILNEIVDNGRVVKADYVTTFFTDIDYKDFIKFYDVEGTRIIDFYYATYSYLPKPFVEYILELFGQKTTLKGATTDFEERLYLKSKQHINGLYGMCVTNIVNDEIKFLDDEWTTEKTDIEQALKKYRFNSNSFLLYQWGVWVTSYARHFLRDTILKIEENKRKTDFKSDFIYCDTDSIKLTNYKRHKHIFDEYNKQNIEDLTVALSQLDIDTKLLYPKTRTGKTKILGVWELENENGAYKNFKTLGAKRYMYEDEEMHLTVSGLNKKLATPYIKQMGGFEFFKNSMYIPPDYTGKNTHTYTDEYYRQELTDYLGNIETVSATHYIHMCKQDYHLSLAREFEIFLSGWTDEDIKILPDNPDLAITREDRLFYE